MSVAAQITAIEAGHCQIIRRHRIALLERTIAEARSGKRVGRRQAVLADAAA